jgi:hypothetical protein
MKKLSFLFCLLYYNFVFVQNDSIFPNLRAEWDIQYRDYNDFPQDYLIGKLRLRKLDENYDTMGLYSYARSNNFEELLIAKIYTDSLKVYANLCSQGIIDDFFTYYTPSLPNQYELLYDFSLEIGDTVFHAYQGVGEYSIVYDLDTLIINGEKRKKIYHDGDIWVQGLGSVFYPLHPKIIGYCWECGPIICSATMEYEGNSAIDTFVYDELKWLCTYNASLMEEQLEVVKLYPNPSSDMLTIELIGNNLAKNIHVYDILGHELLAQVSFSDKTTLQLIELKAGIYFVEIESEGEKFRASFVKE